MTAPVAQLTVLNAEQTASKSAFFDREAVLKAVDRARQRNLSKAGAYVRQRARSLIRTRKRVSRAGEPPSSHAGLLRHYLFFAYDRETQSVVVGPAALNQYYLAGDGRPTQGTVPQVLEKGGQIGFREVRLMNRWKRISLAARRNRRWQGFPQRTRFVTIAPRPYMVPALEREIAAGKIATVWQNTIR